MRFTLVSAMFLSILLAAATGCSATSSQAAKTPASDPADDPSFTPPDQFKMAISEAKPSQAKSDLVNTMPSPNKREIRAGQLRSGY